MQVTQVAGGRTRANPAFCSTQPRPASRAVPEKLPGARARLVAHPAHTPPPTGASLQSRRPAPASRSPAGPAQGLRRPPPAAPAPPPPEGWAGRQSDVSRAGPRPPAHSTCCPWPPRGSSAGDEAPAPRVPPAAPRGPSAQHLLAVSPGGCPGPRRRRSPAIGGEVGRVASTVLSPAFAAAGTPRPGSPAPPPTPRPHPSSSARALPAQGPGRAGAPQSTGGRDRGAELGAWEAPTLRPRGPGSRPGRGPRDPERPRESQSPPRGRVWGVASQPGVVAHGAYPQGWEGGARARPAGHRGSGVGLVGRPPPSLALLGPGGSWPRPHRDKIAPRRGCCPAPVHAARVGEGDLEFFRTSPGRKTHVSSRALKHSRDKAVGGEE